VACASQHIARCLNSLVLIEDSSTSHFSRNCQMRVQFFNKAIA